MLNFFNSNMVKDNKQEPFTVGDSWNDYPFKVFIAYNRNTRR